MDTWKRNGDYEDKAIRNTVYRKIISFQVKDSMGRLNIRKDTTEERVNKLEDLIKELSKKASRKERLREKVRGMENRSKTITFCI